MMPVAAEGALKMMELSAIPTKELDSAALKHGPIAVFPNSNDPRQRQLGVAVLTDATTLEEAKGNLSEIAARGGETVVIAERGHAEELRPKALSVIEVPALGPELSPLLAVLPLQRLASETTKEIDRIARTIGGWAEDLFSLLGRPPGRELVERLEAIQRELDLMRADGTLNGLQADKLHHVEAKLAAALKAARSQQRQAKGATRELISELRGPRLSLIQFIDQQLQLPATQSKLGRLDRERALAALEEARRLPQEEALDLLERRFAVLVGQLNSSSGSAARSYSLHRASKGLAEMLARNLDKPRGLAKEVTV
jgi:hypothetical protein